MGFRLNKSLRSSTGSQEQLPSGFGVSVFVSPSYRALFQNCGPRHIDPSLLQQLRLLEQPDMALSISRTAGLNSIFLASCLLIFGPPALLGDFSSLPVVQGGSVLHIIGVLAETFPGQLYVLGVYWHPHQKTNQKLRMDAHTSFQKVFNKSGPLGAAYTLMRAMGSIRIRYVFLDIVWSEPF